jgi:hypothetical protein
VFRMSTFLGGIEAELQNWLLNRSSYILVFLHVAAADTSRETAKGGFITYYCSRHLGVGSGTWNNQN